MSVATQTPVEQRQEVPPPLPEPGQEPVQELRPRMVAGAALLSSAAVVWLIGAMFNDPWLARAVGAVGVVIGVGLSWLSVRRSGRQLPQAAVIPVAMLAGAIIVSPSATGGTANLPSLVVEALTGGGLLQPPIPFQPGWRFITVVLCAVAGATAVGAASSLQRPRLAVLVPLPILVGAAILQPAGSLRDAGVAGLLVIASLAVAFGADTPDDQGGRSGFEVRRLLRGAALLVVMGAVLTLIAGAGFLFPEAPESRVIPPQRPPAPLAEPDRVIFTAEGEARGPFRVGVLDGYDGEAFLLPPIDPERVGTIEDLAAPRTATGVPADETRTVRLTIQDIRGSTVPLPAGTIDIDPLDALEVDPRTQVVRLLSGRPPAGFSYEVTSLAPPTGAEMSQAPPVTDPALAPMMQAPAAPNEVVTALTEAPDNPFDRIQFLRQRLYNTVVAAGEGRPDPVPPGRVVQMLQDGAEATPFEITAAEVLLARWAGAPARLGYGFYGGEEREDVTEFRPRHGAVWLEVYFDGYGWVPLVGTPPRAKSSLSDSLKNEAPDTLPAQDLAMVVFVPVRRTAIELLYQQVRYWAVILVPVALLTSAVLALGGWARKSFRRYRRRRWAFQRGPRERIWVAYAELRDRMTDLRIGSTDPPPLEFLDAIDPDAEHAELAWLVTRAMWGDLQRDLHPEDVEAAEEMARSVVRRTSGAQPISTRVLAMLSKASLLAPFAPELPGGGRRPAADREPRNAVAERLRRLVLRPATVVLVVLLATALAAPVLFPQREPSTPLPVAQPERVLPSQLGRFTVSREAGLEDSYARPGADTLAVDGAVHTFRQDALVAGSHQLVVLADNVDTSDRRTQERLERSILTGAFTTRPFGPVRIRELHTPEQQVFLWFPPNLNAMQLWVFRADVEDARVTVERTIAYQLHRPHRLPGGPA